MAGKTNPIDPLIIDTIKEVARQFNQGPGLESRLQKLVENLVTNPIPDEDILELVEAIKLRAGNGR